MHETVRFWFASESILLTSLPSLQLLGPLALDPPVYYSTVWSPPIAAAQG